MSNIRKESIHLYIIQFVNYIVPLISLPYLTQVLTLNGMGKLGLAQSIFLLAQALIDFGLTYTAGREVSLHLESKKELRKIYTNVQFLRFLLYLSLSLVASIVLYCIDVNDKSLYYIAIISSGAFVFLPLWVFNGLSKNSIFSKYLIYFKIASLAIVFILIKDSNDYIVAFIVLNSSMVFLGIPVYLYLKRQNIEYDFNLIELNSVKIYFYKGFNVFVGTFLSMTYTNFIPFFIKFFTSDYWVGVYIVVERLTSVLRQMYMPLIQASYGGICLAYQKKQKKQYYSLIKKISFIFFGISILALIGNLIFGKYIIYLLLNDEQVAYKYTFMSMFVVFLVAASMIITYCYILARGLDNILKWIYMLASLLFCIMLYLMKENYAVNLTNIYIVIFCVEAFVLIMQLFYLLIYNKIINQ